MQGLVPRCPICGHAGWHERDMSDECTHCGLQVGSRDDVRGVREEIAAALRAGRLHGGVDGRWRLDGGAGRNAAWALGHVVTDGIPRPAAAVAHRVVLGVAGRPEDADWIVELARRAGWRSVVVVLDGADRDDVRLGDRLPDATIVGRRLDGDYAGQRNAVQDLAAIRHAGDCWVLQIDTDETVSRGLGDALGWMTREADRQGLRSIGLPRCNMVDGVLSALYPDIQYRLNHAAVRYRGRVHERPVVAFARTTLGLCAPIVHHLTTDRIRARSLAYETLLAGAGRSSDEDALLQRFALEARAYR